MQEFINNIRVSYGKQGDLWLQNLPQLINQLQSTWGLNNVIPYTDLSYNYVATAYKDNVALILKIGFNHAEIEQEAAALRHFKGEHAIRLLALNVDCGAMLLERAEPGDTLNSWFPAKDIEALRIACRLIKKIHQVPLNGYLFPHLSDWLSIIDRDWPLPKEQLQYARKIKKTLLNNSSPNILLHGDMHYGNIISNDDQWLMIDPKGVIGDPLYDMSGCLLREPFSKVMAAPNVQALLRQRMNIVSEEASVKVSQIWAWTYVQTLMSICWSLEDGQAIHLKQDFLDILYAMPDSYQL